MRRRYDYLLSKFTYPSPTFLKHTPTKAYSNTMPPANYTTFREPSKKPASIMKRPRDRIKTTTITPKSTTALRGDQAPSMDDIDTTTPGRHTKQKKQKSVSFTNQRTFCKSYMNVLSTHSTKWLSYLYLKHGNHTRSLSYAPPLPISLSQ